jgi:hypothetical protein
MRVTCGVAPADVEQGLQALQLVRDQLVERFLNGDTITDQNARRAIESAVDDVSDVLFETLQRGVIDGGVAIWKSAKGPGLRLAAGIQLANAARLEGTLQTLLAAQLQQPHAPRVEWDWTNIDGIRFHRMIGPNPSGGERELLVGFGPDTLYLAAAENGDARAVIKRALEQSRARVAQELLPLQISLIVSDLAVASGDLAQQAPGLAQAWQQTNRQDRVTIDGQAVPRGVRYRLQLEPEVVKTLAELGANAMQPEANDE